MSPEFPVLVGIMVLLLLVIWRLGLILDALEAL